LHRMSVGLLFWKIPQEKCKAIFYFILRIIL